MRNKKELLEYYTDKMTGLDEVLQSRKAKVKYIITAEILLFVVAVAVAVVYLCGYVSVAVFIPAFCIALASFVGVKVFDRQNSVAIDGMEARIDVYMQNIRYMEGDFSRFDDGKRYENPSHQYSFDMDIFGKGSLYNRLCRNVTTGGADRLAGILDSAACRTAAADRSVASQDKPSSRCGTSVPALPSEIDRRQKAISELAEMEEWRIDFLSAAYKGNIDSGAILKALHEAKEAGIPEAALSRKGLTMVVSSMAIFVVLLILTVFTPLPADFVCLWTVLQLAASIGASAKAIKRISKSVERISVSTKRFVSLLHIITETQFREEDNKQMASVLNGSSGAEALDSLKELKAILDALDRRANVLGLVIFNALGYSDFFLVRRYLRWQRDNVASFERWIDAVSMMDAMVSMATMRYNEQQTVMPVVTDSEDIVFEAKGLYHPFLGEKAVRNDFTIHDSNYYIVTGANMAGKSTFLRSIGVNYILAMCGMPVFAESLRVSVFNLFSSMRTSDDLTHGISYFNAELLRLRQLLDNVRQASHTLIILDEILKGTNSLDKLNGSRMFLEAIAKLPVSGIIATHDLELSKMADEYPARFHNFCFEIKLSDAITYTYRISPGVARNQNATYLLKGILKEE